MCGDMDIEMELKGPYCVKKKKESREQVGCSLHGANIWWSVWQVCEGKNVKKKQ